MVDVKKGSTDNIDVGTDRNKLVDSTNNLVSDGGSSGVSWAALRDDLR